MGKSPIPKTDYVMYFICWVMGKSPIPKMDYVMYFICWVTGGHFTKHKIEKVI